MLKKLFIAIAILISIFASILTALKIKAKLEMQSVIKKYGESMFI